MTSKLSLKLYRCVPEKIINTTKNQLTRYLYAAIQFSQKRLITALILLALVGLTEGAGLLMLIPFLHVLGLGSDSQETNMLTTATEQAFSTLGLPLNLLSILILYVVLIILRTMLVRWQTITLSEIKLGFVDHLRVKLYRAIGRANWLYHSKKRTSELTHVLTSDINRIGQGTHFILQMLVTSVMVLIHIIVAIKISATMTFVALASSGVLLLLLWPQVRKAKKLGEQHTGANKQVFATVSDFLDGIKLAKSYSAEERYSQTFETSTTQLRIQQINFLKSNSFAHMMYQIGAAITLSILLYIAIVGFSLSGAELLVLILIFSRLLPLISRLQINYQHVVHMLPAYSSAMKIQEACVDAKEPMNCLGENSWEPSLKHCISLESIEFSYGEHPTLKDLSFTLLANQTLGIIGSSGAGKSTLADIYAGLLTPNKGSITIDQHQLLPEDHCSWRQAVAYVPQDTFLFHDSVRNNLLWVNPSATEKDLQEVLDLAAAKNFVKQLPYGMDTIIGDKGVRLSGGERQRIALARALLAKPQLLILDEATSALDTEHERQIQQAIESLQGELTIVIIAHRLSTIQHVDQIIVIEEGRLIERGSWDELIAKPRERLRELNNRDLS